MAESMPKPDQTVHDAFAVASKKPRNKKNALDLVCQHELTPDPTLPLRTGRGQWRLARFALRQLVPVWHVALLCTMAPFLIGVLYALSIWPMALVIDYALPEQDWRMWTLAVLFGLGTLVYYIPGFFVRAPDLCAKLLSKYLFQIVRARLRRHFYMHLNDLSLRFFQSRPVGEHMYRAINDVDWVIYVISQSLLKMIEQFASFLWLVLVVGVVIDWKAASFVILYMIPFTAAYHLFFSVRRKVDRETRAREQRINAVLQQGIAGVRTIKAYARQGHELRKFMERHVDYFRMYVAASWLSKIGDFLFGIPLVFGFLPWFKDFIMNMYIFYMVIQGEVSYGKAVVLIFWVNSLSNPLSNLVTEFQKIRLALIPAERVFETMSIEPMLKDKPGAPLAPAIEGAVSFKNVSYSYIKGQLTIDGFSCDIQPGEAVGIVGPSGAGKSTLAKLLLRLYDVDEGRVTIDGWDVRDVNAESFKQQIGTVIQDTYLFRGSIRDNLLFSKPDATEDEIQRAIDMAGLREFAGELPDGVDTDLSEGSRLSGGQRQRIGIARALIRKPRLMILDEPTASLDSTTEAEIMETLWKTIEGRTSIIVSHRLSLIRPLDRIFVLEHGRLVEQGSHDELLEKNGLYAELWHEQCSG